MAVFRDLQGDRIEFDLASLEQMVRVLEDTANGLDDPARQIRYIEQRLDTRGWQGSSPNARNALIDSGLRLGTVTNELRSLRNDLSQRIPLFRELQNPKQGAASGAPRSRGFFGSVAHSVKGFGVGVWEGFTDLVQGVGSMLSWGWERGLGNPANIRDPSRPGRLFSQDAQTIVYAAQNPGAVWNAISEPYRDDWNNGRKSEAIGRGAFAIALFLVPGGALTKGAKGAEGIGTVGRVSKAGEIINDARKVERAGEISGDVRHIQRAGQGAITKAGQAFEDWVSELPRKNTPNNTPRDMYEIRNAGPENVQVHGGGE